MEVHQYQYVGQYLRESRESLRITSEQAARALHIRTKYLHAIESGNLKDLPGKAYIRGYIKNYAEFLGLEPEQVLRAYETFLAHDHGGFFVPDTSLAGHLPSRRMLNWSLIGLLCVYLYSYYNLHNHAEVASIPEESPDKFNQSLDKYRNHVLDTAWKPCVLSEDTSCFLRIRATALIPDYRIHVYDPFRPSYTTHKP